MSQGEVVDFFGKNRPFEGRPELHVRLEKATALLQGLFADDMAGYVVFAVDHKGKWSLGWAVEPEGVIGPRMLCGLAQEAFREELVTETAIRDVLND